MRDTEAKFVIKGVPDKFTAGEYRAELMVHQTTSVGANLDFCGVLPLSVIDVQND